MAKANRDHLVPKQIVNARGHATTVHVKPDSGKPTERGRALGTPPPSSVSVVQPFDSDEIDETEAQSAVEETEVPEKPAMVQLLEPNVEWGNDHLNRRNLRIIQGIDGFEDETYAKMLHAAAERDEDADEGDFEHAFAQTFQKWDQVIAIDDEPTLDVPESAYRSSKVRSALLTSMANNPRVCRGIATEINARKDDPELSDVEPADVRATLELMRDATSDETLAKQTRAYALRVHRDKLLEQISELNRQVSASEAPLRSLVQNPDRTTELVLGDEGYAAITFTPRTTLNTDRALANLTEDEKKRLTVEQYEWKRLKDVVGKERAASFRDPGTVAFSLK